MFSYKNQGNIKCLREWFKVDDKGIITRKPIESYSIYNIDDVLIKIKKVKKKISEEEILNEESQSIFKTFKVIILFVQLFFTLTLFTTLFLLDVIPLNIYIFIIILTILFSIVFKYGSFNT
jgi:hypothetical protein